MSDDYATTVSEGLEDLDWSAPAKADPPESVPGNGRRWKAVAKGDRFHVVSLPPEGLNTIAYSIAECEREEIAEFIVTLYENFRETLS